MGEECVCGFDGVDGVGGQERRKALLPAVVAAFDFAIFLGREGVARADDMKVEGLSELGECVRSGGEKREW